MTATSACRICLAIALTSCDGLFALAATPDIAQPASYSLAFNTPEPVLKPQPEQLPSAPSQVSPEVAAHHFALSLDEAKSRALSSSTIMDLASLQVAAKFHTMEAARRDYLPKLLTSFAYFHFDSDLGTVVTGPGIFNPATSIAVPVFEQDGTTFVTAAVQPITPLLKVREAVNITAADVGAAEAQRAFARRELVKGVQELYFGLLASQRIRAGLEQAVAGARQIATAAPSSPDAQIALVESQQGLLAVDHQVVTLTEQMNALVDLPTCTDLELNDPPQPQIPFTCVDDAMASAVATSPKIHEAQQQVQKAEAALRLAQADYVPTVMAYGFYVNQTATPTIQDDFTGLALTASYVLEWGKKNDTWRASMATVSLARQNLRKEMEDASLNAAKAFHEANRAEQALAYAKQLAELNREVKPPTDPFQLKMAIKARLESELGAIKAELDYRTAVVELSSITGRCE